VNSYSHNIIFSLDYSAYDLTNTPFELTCETIISIFIKK